MKYTLYLVLIFSYYQLFSQQIPLTSGYYGEGFEIEIDQKNQIIKGIYEYCTGWNSALEEEYYCCIFQFYGKRSDYNEHLFLIYPIEETQEEIGAMEVINRETFIFSINRNFQSCVYLTPGLSRYGIELKLNK